MRGLSGAVIRRSIKRFILTFDSRWVLDHGASMIAVIGILFLKETKDVDIDA